MSFLISVSQLKHKLQKHPEDIVIVDVRFQLDDSEAGKRVYLENHLPQAIYLDLNDDLSGKVEEHGGSHPLPDWEIFTAKLGKLGIGADTTVIVYDQQNDMFAARLWWMLHNLGHKKVYILDGGYNQWVEDGGSITTDIPTFEHKDFIAKPSVNGIVNMGQVKEKLDNHSAILIDSRANERYLGKVEPMYSKAGHIPGARNYFWKDVLQEDGLWKNDIALERHFASLSKDEEIIVSCGSGVSACPNVLALKKLGYQNVKLYPGSFSDWISYEANEVEIGEND